ncbi:hypothetical protein J6590_036812 [Homalodisca vitripennis]|nr:hypothetical protein J6590_036812 [Homalodisca vitripennis]
MTGLQSDNSCKQPLRRNCFTKQRFTTVGKKQFSAAVTIIDDDGIAYGFSSNRYAMCSATTAFVYIDSTTIELATIPGIKSVTAPDHRSCTKRKVNWSLTQLSQQLRGCTTNMPRAPARMLHEKVLSVALLIRGMHHLFTLKTPLAEAMAEQPLEHHLRGRPNFPQSLTDSLEFVVKLFDEITSHDCHLHCRGCHLQGFRLLPQTPRQSVISVLLCFLKLCDHKNSWNKVTTDAAGTALDQIGANPYSRSTENYLEQTFIRPGVDLTITPSGKKYTHYGLSVSNAFVAEIYTWKKEMRALFHHLQIKAKMKHLSLPLCLSPSSPSLTLYLSLSFSLSHSYRTTFCSKIPTFTISGVPLVDLSEVPRGCPDLNDTSVFGVPSGMDFVCELNASGSECYHAQGDVNTNDLTSIGCDELPPHPAHVGVVSGLYLVNASVACLLVGDNRTSSLLQYTQKDCEGNRIFPDIYHRSVKQKIINTTFRDLQSDLFFSKRPQRQSKRLIVVPRSGRRIALSSVFQ